MQAFIYFISQIFEIYEFMLPLIGKSHFMRNSYKYAILWHSLNAKVKLTKKYAISQTVIIYTLNSI